MSNRDAARYLDADGNPHRIEVQPLRDGGWAVIDIAASGRRTIETLAGLGDQRDAAVALARDFAAHHHHHRPDVAA